MLYKVFVDDSGNKNYITPYSSEFIKNPPLFDKYEQFWRDNYFVLCGVRISQSNLGKINDEINSLKEKTFGTHHIEIKSDWLRNPFKRTRRYLEKFKVAENELTSFVNQIYGVIEKYRKELKLIAVVFDKRFYGDKKRQSAEGDPLSKTSQVIFERLQYLNTYHVVVFDQMESSLKLDKGSHGKILKVLRNREKLGEVFVLNYDKITDIKFSESSKENFLQIADLCAYNIYRQFILYGREWTGENNPEGNSIMRMYQYFDKIRCNFIHIPEGHKRKVCGVGLVCIPDVNKFNWNLMKGCDNK